MTILPRSRSALRQPQWGPAAALTTPYAALRRMFTRHVPLTILRQNYPVAGMHGRGRDVSCWPKAEATSARDGGRFPGNTCRRVPPASPATGAHEP
jgi:hypothetical protein